MVLHIAVPGLLAWRYGQPGWRRAWLLMLAGMIIDVDHLFATPIFDAHRCGIGFHPLHTEWAIAAYVVVALVPMTRWVGRGLLIHIGLDAVDCIWIALSVRP
jgi:hypothetical protein